MPATDMKLGSKNIWIYSSNVFFIYGVKALVREVFSKKQYIIHIFDEESILNIPTVKDMVNRAFIFSDAANPLYLLYLSLFCRHGIISGNDNIESAQRYLLSGRCNQTRGCAGSHLQGYLSPREREIVACMKSRMTDDEISLRFKLSKKTVSAHRRNILSKLGIRNRNELYKHLFCLQR